ncbi:MAG: hypothetical protein AB1349_12830 [Elusimicrobiota bacterium]
MQSVINKQELLGNIVRFYQDKFRKNKKGKEYLNSLGIYDEQLFERFKIGFADGSLLKAIPTKGEVKDTLKETGILMEDKEYFLDCVVFPVIDSDDNIVDIIGKRIIDPDVASQNGAGGMEIFLNNSPVGILNWSAFKSKEIIFADGIISSLKIFQLGFDNVIPVFHILNDTHLEFLRRYRPNKIYLTVDNKNIETQLTKIDLPCYRVKIGDEMTKEIFEKALTEAEPVETKIGEGIAKITNEKVLFEFGKRKYEVKELDDINPERLRVNIKASGETIFHIDTIDLYSSNSRANFIRQVAELYEVENRVIKSDLCSIITKLEKMREKKEIKTTDEKIYQMTVDEEEQAMEFLKSPDILEKVVQHLEILGYVGEDTNKKIGYLITISRKLENPLSGVIISRSGAGKSKLLEYLSELVPEEDLINCTRLTPKALYYLGEKGLKHKLLIAGEEEGLFGSNYPIRELISSKKLKLVSPVKDTITGKMTTAEYEVEGPIALLFSTTQPAINYENATRCWTLSLDEGKEQTNKIHQAQQKQETLAGVKNGFEISDIKTLHKNAQRLLKKLVVINSFAEQLSFPTEKLEMRREYEKYLSLIKAIAFLYQYQREKKTFNHNGKEIEYIEVEKEDIKEANKLISEIFGTSADELSRPSRELLKMIKQMVDEKCKEQEIGQKDFRFNRRDVREYTGWSDSQIKAHIKQLEDLQYLLISKSERGKMYRYELQYEGNGGKKYLFGLTDPDKLIQKSDRSGKVCQEGDDERVENTDEEENKSLKVGKVCQKRIKGGVGITGAEQYV